MTKARTTPKPKADTQADPTPDDTEAHTELRRAGAAPRPRAKVMPPELRDDPGDDDMFNDMPV